MSVRSTDDVRAKYLMGPYLARDCDIVEYMLAKKLEF